jgi:hypothetical protein
LETSQLEIVDLAISNWRILLTGLENDIQGEGIFLEVKW